MMQLNHSEYREVFMLVNSNHDSCIECDILTIFTAQSASHTVKST